MKHVARSFLLALALLTTMGAGQAALANTEELVTSIHHGGNPFMVVTKDSDGGSNRDPGLWGRARDSWRQIISGNVLQDERKGFWLKQLRLSHKDELYHTLLVIDGKLHLVNLFSDTREPATELAIGTKEFPLTEVLTGQRRTLPRINSVGDVSFVAFDNQLDDLNYQLVLISVRCESCNGDGMTVAIAVKPMTESRRTYELVGKPWVIDYKFYPQSVISELGVYDRENKNFQLRSGIATEFLLNTDFSVYGPHEKLVEEKVKLLMSSNIMNVAPPVTVDLRNGQIATSIVPSSKYHLGAQNFTFTQQFNLRNQSGQLHIKDENNEITLPGLIDFKAPGEAAIFGEAERNSSIFAANGKLYLVHADQRISVVELGPSPIGNQPTEIYDYIVESSNKEGGIKRRILILSTTDQKGAGKVEAYKLAFHTTGQIIVEDRVKLLDIGLQAHELQVRLRTVDGNVLFDTLTPPSESLEVYNQVYDRSRPLVNITASDAIRLNYSFAEPLEVLESGTTFEYRTYAKSTLINNPTGLYQTTTNEESEKAPALGQLLNRHDDNSEPLNHVFTLAELNSVKMEGLGDVSVKLMAIDSTFKDGVSGFKLTAAFSSNSRTFDTKFVEAPLSIPFNQLLSARFFAGRKSHSAELALVLSYEKDTVMGRREGFTTFIKYKGVLQKDQVRIVSEKEVEVMHGAMDSSQTSGRFIYDEEGRIHFIIDPKTPRDDRRFETFNLFDKIKNKPNVEKGIKLLWDAKEEDNGEHFDERKVPWRLHPNDIEKRFAFIQRRSRDAEAGYLWGKLFDLLDQMALQRESDKIHVLLVPPDMKKYVNELIITRYARRVRERDANPFNWNNRNLRLFQFDPDNITQDDILDNLDSIQKNKTGVNIILADMLHINKANRPIAKTANFQITKVVAEGESEFGEDVSAEEGFELPHALYLLAAGEPIQPEELEKKPFHAYGTLIVSTPEEWADAQFHATSEMEGGLDKRFEVINFPLPTAEDRAKLLGQVFEDKNVVSLRLQFDAHGITKNLSTSQDAQMSKLLEYAVMRVSSEAENAKQDGLNAFVQFRNLFAQQLLRDRTVRRNRVVDKAFVERVLTSVFDIPVNLESLPPDDPIFILSKKDAVRQLQDRGVEGPFAIKARVIKTMLSVLKFDPTRAIPSTHIVIGESGSGKTRMVTGLLDWLFPLKYDFNNPGKNVDANSIRINVGKMVESRKDSKGGDQLTFEEVRDHINNFLINGFRGAIFLDDFHAAPEAVRTQLLGFVRTLLETQGLYNAASSYTEQVAQVPLRHLHLFIALNPTENVAWIDTFRKDKTSPATFDEVLMASLSTKDYKVERSFLKRIGAIHNLLKFPHGAKAPALAKETLLTARDIMLRKQKLVINSAGAIRSVADSFPLMDARTFLSTASAALVDQVDPQLFPHGTLFHVVPGRRRLLGGFAQGDSIDESEKGKIEEFVQRNTKVMPLNDHDQSPESQLHFIRTLVRNFRLPVIEQFLISLEDDVRFSESIENQRNFLLPAMMAVRNQMNQNIEIPLNELNLDPNGFGLKTAGDRALFKELMNEVSSGQSRYFPFPIPRVERAEGWDILITGRTDDSIRSRSAMITRYYHKVAEIMTAYTKKFYYLDSLEGMPDPEKWLRKLPTTSTEAKLKPSIDELRELFWKFISDINDPSLRERNEQDEAHLTPYSIARIFLYLVDKSMTDLPWIQINKHLIRSLDHVVQDQVLGQSPGVKSYFFEYKYSPIRAASPELVLQLAESSQLSTEYTETSQSNIHRDYSNFCERLLGGQQ